MRAEFLNRYLPYLLALVLVSACAKDDDNEVTGAADNYTVTFSYASIDGSASAQGEMSFCNEVETRQASVGTRSGDSDKYSSSLGVRVSDNGRLKIIGSRMLGESGSSDTLLDATVSPFLNVEQIITGSDRIQPYVELEAVVDDVRYATLVSFVDRATLDKRDAAAVSRIDYTLETGGSCRGGDNLIIKTELYYDGYAYNLGDVRDSIRIADFTGVVYNYSY